MLSKLFRRKKTATKEKMPLEGIDEETLAIAKEIAYEKQVRKAVNAKWKKPRKGSGDISDDEIMDALRSMQPSATKVMQQVFARTVEDTVLANRFVDADNKVLSHLTVKKAAAMDGLRDLDDEVGVSSSTANPMNPEGRFRLPTSCAANHQFAERFNEAMNPIRGGFRSVVPIGIMEHFANFATFIGYPLCETIACHPTVSNACTIPGEDAIAPGYKLTFVDSEDLNHNGIPDELEAAEFGGIKRSLGRIEAMEALKDAIVTISDKEEYNRDSEENTTAALNALALALERLSAYETWEREQGKGEETAQAVHEGFVKPISSEFVNFSKNKTDEAAKKSALKALTLALADLSKKEHPVLDEVRATNNRRGTIAAVEVAIEVVNKPEDEWVLADALNALAVAVERVGAYEALSDRNAEAMAALNMALIDLSVRKDSQAKRNVVDTLGNIRSAMDEDEFDFEDPAMDGVADTEKKGTSLEPPNTDDLEKQNQMVAAMVAKQQESQAAEQEKAKKEEEQENKRQETRLNAEIAKERQRYLDHWKQRADDMGLNEICTRLARNARVFGIGIAIPVIDDVDYEQPMNIDIIKEGAYRGFTVVEPTWIYPEVDSEDLINPLSPSFFEPLYWSSTGSTSNGAFGIKRIHRSWMIIVRNKEVPNMLRPMYYYGGLPLTQEIYEAVFCADKVMNEVPKLAMTKRTTVVKGDPNDLVTNPEGVVERLNAYSQVQDNFGMLFVGRNSDVTKLETSLSEFDQLIAKCNQRVAAIAKMPETKLFKTQLAGMNSAGRYEWDDYSQLLINIQNNWFKKLLSLHYKLDTKSQTGKVIEIKINFNPIDVPTQAEKCESESRIVQTINSAVQGGWLAPGEARTIARSREDSMFSAISAEMPKELEEQQQQPQGGGDMPPMGGGEGGESPDLTQLLGGDMNNGGAAGSPLDAPDAPKEPKAPQERK